MASSEEDTLEPKHGWTKAERDMKELHLIGIIGTLTVALFALDFSLPLGVATGMLYAGILLLTSASRYQYLPVIMASVASGLIGIGGMGPTTAGVPVWLGITNRLLSVLIIWIALFFLLQRRRAEEALRQAQTSLEVRVQERTSELARVNKALVAEITERIDTEESLRSSQSALGASQRALQQSQEDLRALTARLLTALEDERRRISRDLHDDINQRLAMMVVELDGLEHAYPEMPVGLGSRLRSLQDNTAELSEDVRLLAYQYHPSVLDDLGLGVALQRLIEDFSTRSGLACTFHHADVPKQVPSTIATCLYRITQESLTNAAKHAQATQVGVRLHGGDEMLALSITDNGAGLPPDQRTHERGGLGLASMMERARLVKGVLEIQSQPGRGTTIHARIPMPV